MAAGDDMFYTQTEPGKITSTMTIEDSGIDITKNKAVNDVGTIEESTSDVTKDELMYNLSTIGKSDNSYAQIMLDIGNSTPAIEDSNFAKVKNETASDSRTASHVGPDVLRPRPAFRTQSSGPQTTDIQDFVVVSCDSFHVADTMD